MTQHPRPPMRRSDRAVTEEKEIARILDACKICNLALPDSEAPYVVPLSFGYTISYGTLKLYFHSAPQGRKVDLLYGNPHVGFAISRETGDVCAENPCRSGCWYESVLGSGTACILTDADEKCAALRALMQHQFEKDVTFTSEQADAVCVFCVTADVFTAKRKKA